MHASGGDFRNEAHDVGMHQRLTSLERHVTNAAAVQDRQRSHQRIRIHVSSRADKRLVPGKTTKVAGSIADVRD